MHTLSQEAIPISWTTLPLKIQCFFGSNSATTHPVPPLSTHTRDILLFSTSWVCVRQCGMAKSCGVGEKVQSTRFKLCFLAFLSTENLI